MFTKYSLTNRLKYVILYIVKNNNETLKGGLFMTNFEKWVGKMNTYFGEDYLNGSCDIEWFLTEK